MACLLVTALPSNVACLPAVSAAGLLRALGTDVARLAAVVAGLLVGAVAGDVACRRGKGNGKKGGVRTCWCLII